MAGSRKVIITCAVTGAIHVPSQTPHLPITPAQILESALGAAEAGASIIHLHARHPETGAPDGRVETFREFLEPLKAGTNAVINITTGGDPTKPIEERLAAPMALAPEMCSLNMGSMNFGLYPMAARIKTFEHEWEPAYLERSRSNIFRNTFADIEYILRELGEERGVRFEHECYDTGHLYTLAHFMDRGLVKGPIFIQTIFGILGGIGPHPEDLMHMKRTADRLFGDQYVWSILGAGRHQYNLVTTGATMGGNVRVGLEDNIYLGKGVLAESNADMVKRIRTILTELSLDVATPDEARKMLALKGAENVNF